MATSAPPTESSVTEPLSPSQEIDARRAAHGVARAQQLAERGELNAAILACRQSLALVPNLFEAHALLGALLAHKGDREAAAESLERALQINPDAPRERQALAQLRQSNGDSALPASEFVFNDAELFDNAAHIEARLPPSSLPEAERLEAKREENNTAPPPFVTVVLPSVGAAEADADPTSRTFGAIDPSTLISPVPSTPLSTSANTASVSAPVNAPAAPAPVAAPVQTVAPAPVRTPVPAPVPMSVPMPTAVSFNDRASAPRPTTYGRWSSSSLYARTLPLTVAALLGLGVLLWARARVAPPVVTAPTQIAVNDAPPVPVDEPVNTTNTAPNVNSPTNPTNAVPSQRVAPAAPVVPSTPPTNPNAAPSNAAGRSGFTITNQPNVAVGDPPLGAANSTNSSSPRAASNAPTGDSSANPVRSGSANRPRTTSGSSGSAPRANTPNRAVRRSEPRFPSASRPSVSLPPAALPPAAPRRSAARNDASRDNDIALPRPQINLPTASRNPDDTPVRALPPGGSNGIGGSPLNPAGSNDRDYIRVREGRVGTGILPQRPENQGRGEERAASEAARSGQTDAAISRLSSAINSDSSDGFRFQQRATLFLERGDARRAADDFQSAISAYQSQINRGEDVAQARAGLRAARSGLSLALSRSR